MSLIALSMDDDRDSDESGFEFTVTPWADGHRIGKGRQSFAHHLWKYLIVVGRLQRITITLHTCRWKIKGTVADRSTRGSPVREKNVSW
jgi:hypothetical protein